MNLLDSSLLYNNIIVKETKSLPFAVRIGFNIQKKLTGLGTWNLSTYELEILPGEEKTKMEGRTKETKN